MSAKTGTPIYHADQPASGHAGRILGIASLRLKDGRLASQKWRSVPLDPAIKDDPAMAAWSEQQGR